MKNILLLTAILWGFAGVMHSQQIMPYVIATAGDFYSNQNFSVSWTLGEIVTETIGTDVIFTQGFQQPSYSIGNDIPQIPASKYQIKVFPIPAYDELTVQVKGNDNTDLNIELFDALGRKLISARMETAVPETRLDLTSLHPGVYFLKVSTVTGEKIRTCQIAKAIK